MSHFPYDDIVNLSRPVSENHPPMSMTARGAQFSPFAALTGYDAVIQETARLTRSRIQLDENEKEILDQKLRAILVGENQAAVITCFRPDPSKPGGEYVRVCGTVKKVELHRRMLILADGTQISLDDILDIQQDY